MNALITFVTWKWGEKYDGRYVARLYNGIARNFHAPFRFVCFADVRGDIAGHIDVRDIENPELLAVDDGCYVRLRMFDPNWQARHEIKHLVCLDLDVVIVGDITPLFSRDEPFMILKGGHFNPCPYNGSVMMLRAGYSPRVWYGFETYRALALAYPDGQYRGTDQTWIAALLPDAAHWTFRDGIYAFRKPGWPKGSDEPPADARMIVFPGAADPAKCQHLPWIKQFWR